MDKSKDLVPIIGYYILDAPGMRADRPPSHARVTCLNGTLCSEPEITRFYRLSCHSPAVRAPEEDCIRVNCCLRQHHRDSQDVDRLNGRTRAFHSRQCRITQTRLPAPRLKRWHSRIQVFGCFLKNGILKLLYLSYITASEQNACITKKNACCAVLGVNTFWAMSE